MKQFSLYEKSKVNHEEATGSFVPSLSNDSPYNDNVTQPLGNVNNNDMQNNKKYSRQLLNDTWGDIIGNKDIKRSIAAHQYK